MNLPTALPCALSERRALCGHKFRFLAVGAEPFQYQKSLILTAAPGCLEIHHERLHGFSPLAPGCSCSINLPSLAYFSRTERAAICEIRAPR